jgi:hypothetical protein
VLLSSTPSAKVANYVALPIPDKKGRSAIFIFYSSDEQGEEKGAALIPI